MSDEVPQPPPDASERVVEIQPSAEMESAPDIVLPPETVPVETGSSETLAVEPAALETPPTPSTQTPISEPPPKPSAGAHMRAVVKNRKQERLEKIIALANENSSIVNNDVEMLLKVSDATATRYLSELVRNGRLKRSGGKFHEQYEPLGGSNSAI